MKIRVKIGMKTRVKIGMKISPLFHTRDMKASIILKDEATSRFLIARPIPYALKSNVDKELWLMVSPGVIPIVETMEYA